MFVGSNQPRSQRSFAGKAPIPSNSSFEPTESVETTYTIRRTEIKPFKFESEWINYQLDGLFKGWGVDE